MLVYQGGGLNIICSKVMIIITKTNHFNRVFWCGVSMERTDGAVDIEHLRIGWYTEGANLGGVRLSWFDLNIVECFTIGGVNCDCGDNFWVAVSFRINLSYGMSNLEGEVVRGRQIIFLLSQIFRETDIVGLD